MTATLEISRLTVELGGRPVVVDASVAFEAGQLWAVIGRSGAGKSVLMKAASGLLPFTTGAVRVRARGGVLEAGPDDEDAFALIRRRLSFVHQDPALLDDLTVRENVGFALSRRGLDDGGGIVSRWLSALSLDEVAARLPRELSPGQLRKVALCRALCLSPEVLVVDEPTTGLDPIAAREVDSALASLAESGSTLIVITHDRRSLTTLSPHIAWVDRGRVRYVGPLGKAARAGYEELSALLEGRPLRDARHEAEEGAP